ncbi:MAG: cytochrome c biogenesis protein CcsA [Planctomycetes bacterium]|nr:cytochrome c biogenesis protein CcsA [Planctomycetota bacterium]
MPEFGYLDFSRSLNWVALGLNAFAILAALIGLATRDRRWVRCARNALIGNAFVLVASAGGLIAGFVNGAYEVEYIHDYSERALPLGYKIAGLWAGLDGSILFWAMLLSILSALVAFRFRKEEAHPVGARLEPHVYIVLAVIQVFFVCVVAFAVNPFETFAEARGEEFFRQHFPSGRVEDGAGLTPLLVNYWMQIHPPCMYTAWVTYTIPFAFGIAALLAGEHGLYWIRKVRRWMLAGWFLNTAGCVLGGLWAYEVLGWGGYWAWDPVENASIITWFPATAFLHSIMIQERRGMLKIWNAALISLTYFLTIFGTWLTRSGAVASFHSFANGTVGAWFAIFMAVIAAVVLFLLVYRRREFRAENRIKSIFSREAIFVLNNTILIAISAVIVIFTLYPLITYAFFRETMSVKIPVFNLACGALFVVLLALTAIGPGTGWVYTSGRNFLRNYAWAGVVSLPLAAIVHAIAMSVHQQGGEGEATIAEQIYPTAVIDYLGVFIVVSLALEVWRTARNRMARRNETIGAAIATIFVKNSRRYGGYVVHVGLALMAIGIVNSSMLSIERSVELEEGQSVAIGDYVLKMVEAESDKEFPVYERTTVQMNLMHDGATIANLVPERRLYRKKQQVVSEPEIHHRLLQDVYVFFQNTNQAGVFEFKFYRKPLIGLVWLGWLTMLAGGLWAAVPIGRRRVGLAE